MSEILDKLSLSLSQPIPNEWKVPTLGDILRAYNKNDLNLEEAYRQFNRDMNKLIEEAETERAAPAIRAGRGLADLLSPAPPPDMPVNRYKFEPTVNKLKGRGKD